MDNIILDDVAFPLNTEVPNLFNDKLTCKKRVKNVINSHQWQKAIIFLVVIDCICVAVELMLDLWLKKVVANREIKHSRLVSDHHLNKSSIIENIHPSAHHEVHHESSAHFYLEIFEEILKYSSLSILGFFILELIFKLIFMPKYFLKNKFEIFDGFVIVVSFTVNIVLFFFKEVIYSIGGLLTVLRLWRITEIINAAIFEVQIKHEEKIHEYKSQIKDLSEENRRLCEILVLNGISVPDISLTQMAVVQRINDKRKIFIDKNVEN